MMRNTIEIGPDRLEDQLFWHLNLIEQRLQNASESQQPIRYCVKVDGFPVVGPTKNANAFANVIEVVNLETTRTIEVRLFKGESSNNDQHLYLLKRPKSEGLNGLEIRVQNEVEKVKKEFAFQTLKNDFDQLTRKCAELKERNSSLKTELENFRTRRFYFGEVNLLDLGGIMLEGALKRNIHLLRGVGGAANPTLAGPPEDQSKDTQQFSEYCAAILKLLNEEQVDQINRLLNLLATFPQMIGDVVAFAADSQPTNS